MVLHSAKKGSDSLMGKKERKEALVDLESQCIGPINQSIPLNQSRKVSN